MVLMLDCGHRLSFLTVRQSIPVGLKASSGLSGTCSSCGEDGFYKDMLPERIRQPAAAYSSEVEKKPEEDGR